MLSFHRFNLNAFMMKFYWPEPSHKHGTAPRTAIVLVNLGTPAAPTAAAVKPYLKEFLSDRRVVEIPPLIWQPILRGIILNTRPQKSAAKYASIWLKEGSPLKVHTEQQAHLLGEHLRQVGHTQLTVTWAMRYGQPGIQNTLNRLRAEQYTRILIIPLYPQYAASTTASVMDEVALCLTHWRNLPEIRYVRNFHTDPGYIRALTENIRQHWSQNGQSDKLVLSFHGVPRRSLTLGDPYFCECHTTARLIGEALSLPAERLLITFQSRFGKAEWLQPYTQTTLEQLGKQGFSVDVICPGFVSDCLETLEEIAMECRTAFLAAGGKRFHYIPCLNTGKHWIQGLSSICEQHLGHWLTDSAPSEEYLQVARQNALQQGAVD